MPISQTGNDSYYFWLWAKDSPNPSRDIVIWLMGGPDCSSILVRTDKQFTDLSMLTEWNTPSILVL
jgi:hypothetical protein